MAVIFACVIFNRLSAKLGIPTLLAFILLGMFFGSDGVVKIPFDNYHFAEQICSVALIFIMFYGGFGTKWKAAKGVALRSILLSTLGVVITFALVGFFAYYALGFKFLEAMLIGAVISSTDAASVFSILRSKRLNLKYSTASLLELESGSNDPASYMLTVIVLSAIQGNADGFNTAILVFLQVFLGLLFGACIAVASLYFIKRFKFSTEGFDAIFVFAVAVLAYAAPTAVGGNGYLSAYIVGIVLGNAQISNKRSLVHFFDAMTGLMQMLLFFLLGLLSFPSQMSEIIWPAMLIAIFLTFVARPIAVFGIMSPFKCRLNQKLFVAWAGLRGAASIVFAVMAIIGSDHLENDIFNIVFMIVIFSILFQGSAMSLVARKLGMIDDSGNVMKTFTDYSDEEPVRFIEINLPENHSWVNKKVASIDFPPDTILVLVERGEKQMVPQGGTRLKAGDSLILSANAPSRLKKTHNSLKEKYIDNLSTWANRTISTLPKKDNTLIIMIKRKGDVIIPNGSTTILQGDTLVINRKEQDVNM